MKIIGLIVTSFLLVVTFQNCGSDVNFESIGAEELTTKTGQEIADVGDSQNQNNEDLSVDDLDIEIEDVVEEIDDAKNVDHVPPGKKDIAKKEHEKKYDDPDNSKRVCGNRLTSNDTLYICIVDGPGKSERVGVKTGKGKGQIITACMTRKGCAMIAENTDIRIKAVGFRGYCKHSGAKVMHVSDDQIISYIENHLISQEQE